MMTKEFHTNPQNQRRNVNILRGKRNEQITTINTINTILTRQLSSNWCISKSTDFLCGTCIRHRYHMVTSEVLHTVMVI